MATASPAHIFVVHGHALRIHGRDHTRRPLDRRAGHFELDRIINALTVGGNRVEVRLIPSGADTRDEAQRLARQVQQRIDSGIAPVDIVLLAFARGAGIAVRAARTLDRAQLSVILIGGCERPLPLHPYDDSISVWRGSASVAAPAHAYDDPARCG